MPGFPRLSDRPARDLTTIWWEKLSWYEVFYTQTFKPAALGTNLRGAPNSTAKVKEDFTIVEIYSIIILVRHLRATCNLTRSPHVLFHLVSDVSIGPVTRIWRTLVPIYGDPCTVYGDMLWEPKHAYSAIHYVKVDDVYDIWHHTYNPFYAHTWRSLMSSILSPYLTGLHMGMPIYGGRQPISVWLVLQTGISMCGHNRV